MSTSRKILIADDDEDLRELLCDQLALHNEFKITAVSNASLALQAVQLNSYDIAILSNSLHDIESNEVYKVIRQSGFKAPIVILTNFKAETGEFQNRNAGAYTYIIKPFKFAVLLAHIRAQIQRHEQTKDLFLTLGHYTFRPNLKLLVDGEGTKVQLTEKETSILEFLYHAGEKVMSRNVLLHEIWGYNMLASTHTLETHIYRLRQKIERDPANAKILVTMTGGYKLIT
ncbi:MAG: response regulator transcription factor [Hyphomicrobiaceae bacterium]|nr:response regulator transcription factor [Hyphomicrobiaceae bacterium]